MHSQRGRINRFGLDASDLALLVTIAEGIGFSMNHVDWIAYRVRAHDKMRAREQSRTRDRDHAIRLFAGALRDYQQQRDADKIDQSEFQYVTHLTAIKLLNTLDKIESR